MMVDSHLEINSHIQVPKLLLKKFSHREIEKKSDGKSIKTDYVYCLNLSSKEIELADIKELNTKLGYYTNDIEKKLNEVETNFGRSVKKINISIKKLKNNENPIFEIDELIKPIKDFVLYTMIRSKSLRHKICSSHILYHDFPHHFTHSNIIDKGEIVFERNNYLKDYLFTIMCADNYSFVLPKCCWYSGIISTEVIALPISPDLAILLFPSKNLDDFISPHNELKILRCLEEEVKKANRLALAAEQNKDNEFLVAKQPQELLDLIPFIK